MFYAEEAIRSYILALIGGDGMRVGCCAVRVAGCVRGWKV